MEEKPKKGLKSKRFVLFYFFDECFCVLWGRVKCLKGFLLVLEEQFPHYFKTPLTNFILLF